MQITVEIEKTSLNKLSEKLKRIKRNLPNHVESGLKQALEDTQKTALNYKPGKKSQDLIKVESSKQAKYFTGRVYTDKDNFDYAPFVEYGTGTFAELPHIGVTEHFWNSAFKEWFLPVHKVKEKLNNPIVLVKETKGGHWTGNYIKCYLIQSMQPRPFMRQTAFEKKTENIETIANAIREGISDDIK